MCFGRIKPGRVIGDRKRKRRIQEVAALAQSAQLNMPALDNPHGSVSFRPTKERKKVQIDEQFPERTITIGVGLDAK